MFGCLMRGCARGFSIVPYTKGRTALCCWVFYLGVSENRGPDYSTLNSRIFIIRIPDKVPLIFGNSHLIDRVLEGDLRPSGFGIRSFRFDLYSEGSKSY